MHEPEQFLILKPWVPVVSWNFTLNVVLIPGGGGRTFVTFAVDRVGVCGPKIVAKPYP